MKKRIVIFTLLAIVYAMVLVPADAATTPSFPSCLNPQGTPIASYAEGVHGIPGRSETYNGADTVYKVTDETLIQCFCPEDGDGIQTNWMKASNLSEGEIESYKAAGWIYIPDGSAWGLDQGAYLAKNNNYSCRGGIGGANSSRKHRSSKKSTSSPSSAGAAVLGQVLGLASTGSLESLYNLWLVGLIALTTGVWLKWLKQRHTGKKF